MIEWLAGRQQGGCEGGSAGSRRHHLASLHTVRDHDGEVLQVAAGARPRRPAVVITLLGRDCFEGRVLKWGEDSEMLRQLLHFQFLVFVVVHQTVECCALCYATCFNDM